MKMPTTSRTNGWDERDYKLSAQIKCLPSFGLIAGGDRMISEAQVFQILKNHAEQRFDEAHNYGNGKDMRTMRTPL
jgi:hypothetical protein